MPRSRRSAQPSSHHSSGCPTSIFPGRSVTRSGHSRSMGKPRVAPSPRSDLLRLAKPRVQHLHPGLRGAPPGSDPVCLGHWRASHRPNERLRALGLADRPHRIRSRNHRDRDRSAGRLRLPERQCSRCRVHRAHGARHADHRDRLDRARHRTAAKRLHPQAHRLAPRSCDPVPALRHRRPRTQQHRHGRTLRRLGVTGWHLWRTDPSPFREPAANTASMSL